MNPQKKTARISLGVKAAAKYILLFNMLASHQTPVYYIVLSTNVVMYTMHMLAVPKFTKKMHMLAEETDIPLLALRGP